jgi:hypothetical protein
MKIKWVIGRKTNFVMSALWTIYAIVNFAQGDWKIGALEVLLAMYILTDALRGDKVALLDIKIGKEAK